MQSSSNAGHDVCVISLAFLTHFLCHRKHYKEYLVGKINQGHLDPVTMHETEKVKVILLREELAVPEREGEEEEEDYRERLIKVRKWPWKAFYYHCL